MSPTQIKAAEILLKKVLPDLRQTEVTGPEGGPVLSNINLRFVDAPADPTPSSSEDTDD